MVVSNTGLMKIYHVHDEQEPLVLHGLVAAVQPGPTSANISTL